MPLSSFSAPKCRLCECPVLDGGVALSTVDTGRLSCWWKSSRGVPLQEETVRDGWSCMNCVWRAKTDFEKEGGQNGDLEWWPGDLDPFFKYYKEGWIKPCFVRLTSEEADSYQEKKSDLEITKPESAQKSCPERETSSLPRRTKKHNKKKIVSPVKKFYSCSFCKKRLPSVAAFQVHSVKSCSFLEVVQIL